MDNLTKKQIEVLKNLPFSFAPRGDPPCVIAPDCEDELSALGENNLAYWEMPDGGEEWQATAPGDLLILQVHKGRTAEYFKGSDGFFVAEVESARAFRDTLREELKEAEADATALEGLNEIRLAQKPNTKIQEISR